MTVIYIEREYTEDEVYFKNLWIKSYANRVYKVAETHVKFQKAEQVDCPVKVECVYKGQEMIVYLSRALMNAILAPKQMTLENFNQDSLDLFVFVYCADVLPKNLAVKSITLKPAEVTYVEALEAVDVETREVLNWQLGFEMKDKAQPITGVLGAFDEYFAGKLKHPVLKHTVALPLIATTQSFTHAELEALEFGDVLVLGRA